MKAHVSGPLIIGPPNSTSTLSTPSGIEVVSGDCKLDNGNFIGNFIGSRIGAPSSSTSTISAVAGAANTSTITIQLKDGAGTNIAKSVPFSVYASSASNGLTIASAASTGFSVASGGVAQPGGEVVTQGIKCISSATGGCVLSLLDTGKQTSYLVLVTSDGLTISAQLSAGSYG
jgi:hypothetical protein